MGDKPATSIARQAMGTDHLKRQLEKRNCIKPGKWGTYTF